jgi:tetratricopeptide (TPR) repeat protein
MLLKDEVLIVNGFLSQWDYKNITAVALRVEAFDWAYDFIMNFKEKIRAEDRENAYSFNLANYYYHKKEYEKTMSLVQHVVFTDTYYNLDCKVLLMKSYFELEEIQALQSLIDSFYMYLKRNKAISEFQRSSYLNFLRIVRKLLRLKPGDEKKRAAILLELDRSHPIANVSWLKKKLNPA